MLKNFIDIIAAPRQAFSRLREKPGWVLPWLAVAVLAASVQYGFYKRVDPEYLLEQLIEQRLDSGIAESELRNRMQGIVDRTDMLALTSSIAVFVSLLVVYALTAAYLYWISKFNGADIRYKQWLALASWSGVPAVFTVLAAWLVILSSGSLIDVEAMNPLNLNYLLFRSEGQFSGMLNAFNLIAIWGIVLLILGYRQFTGVTQTRAAIVVLSPYLLILLVWALVIVS